MIKTMRHFPLHSPPYPCNKSASRRKNEEEDEDGNGKLGLFEWGQSNQTGHDTLSTNCHHCTIIFIDTYPFSNATSLIC